MALFSRTATKIPTEAILDGVYPQSYRLEGAIKQLLPHCQLRLDTDPPSYIKLCCHTLVASERSDLLSRDASVSQTLNIPIQSGQSTLESVLNSVPAEVRFCACSCSSVPFIRDLGVSRCVCVCVCV